MVKKIIAGVFLMVFLFSLVSAADTEITVRTAPYMEVHLSIMDSSDSDAYINVVSNTSDYWGNALFSLDISESSFYVKVRLKKNDQRVLDKEFDELYVSGAPVLIEIIPEGYEDQMREVPTIVVENETLAENETLETNSTNSTAEESTNKSKLSGSAISEKVFTWNTLYYSLGFIALVVIAFFTVRFLRKRKQHSPKDVKIKKLSEMKQDKEEELDEHEENIDKLQSKIKNAQRELEQLRKKDKISELKKEIVQKEKELLSLRKGGKKNKN